MASIMTFPLPARPALALPILAGLAMISLPAAAQQQPYGGNGYGTGIVGAYNPYTQAGPRSTQGRAYGAAPVTPPRPGVAPGGPRVPYAAPPAGQVGAYNPWRPQPAGGYAPTTGARPPAFSAPYGPYSEADRGANLPPPPPGPIRSRLLSVPETGNPQGAPAPFQSVPYAPRRSGAMRPPAPPRTSVAAAPAPQVATNGAATDTPPPAPAPTPRLTNPPRAAAKPAPAPAAEPKPAPPAPVAAAKPPEPPKPAPVPVAAAKPPEPPKPAPTVIVERPTQMAAAPPAAPAPTPARPAANGAARIVFEANSPGLSPDARAALDKLAADLIANPSPRKTTLKAYSAGGTGPETRRLSLARGLAVRAYLIDKGVARERLDVQALGASADGGPVDRVDVVTGAGT